MRRIPWLLMALALAKAAETADPRSAAVRAWEAPGGAPIHAGVSTNRPVAVGEAWQEVAFAGTATQDDAAAFLQINVGSDAGTLWIRDLRVVAADGRELLSAPAGAEAVLRLVDARGIGAAVRVEDGAIRLDSPRRVEFPWDVQLMSAPLALARGAGYQVRFSIRGTRPAWPVTSYLMRRDPLRFYAAAGERMLVSTAVLARGEGVRDVRLGVNLPWPRPGEAFDAAEAVEALRQVRAAVPDARLTVVVGLEPPGWWRQANPDELLRWANGRTHTFASPASRRWRDEACANLAALVRALEAAHGEAIAAWQPTAQSTGEWYYPKHLDWGDCDTSPAGTAAFRAWLRARHRDDAGLSAAWGRPAAIDAVEVPVGAARRAGPSGPFRDPVADRDLLDLAEHQQDVLADALAAACAAIRGASAKPVVAYYGYTLELAGCREGAGHTGHLALGRLLADGTGPDVFAGMVAYADRGPGGSAGLMAPAESIRLHGRAWAVEDDSRTHRSAAAAGFYRTADLAATRNAVVRQFAEAAAHRSRTWLLDLYGEGWFHDREVWADLMRVAAAAGPFAAGPAAHQVAVVVDERSWLAFKPGIALSGPLSCGLREDAARMGRPAGFWLLSDLVAGRIPPTALTVVANAVWLDGGARARLRAAVAARGGTVLWLYAPGWLSERGADPAAVEALTGIPVAALPWTDQPWNAAATIAGRRIRLPAAPGAAPVLLPREAPGIEVLGRDAAGRPVLAAADLPGFRSVLCALPRPGAALLGELADAAGAHRWASDGVVVSGGGGLLTLASAAGGPTGFRVPQGTAAEAVWPPGAASVPDLSLAPGETRVLRLFRSP